MRAKQVAIALIFGLSACGQTTQTACGAGTVEVAGACVPDPDALSCGAGTAADGGVCYAADAGADVGSDGVADSAADADAAVDASETLGDVPCLPNCAGRACGDDGCGGSCGTCTTAAAPVCNSLGVCVASCKPECTGKSCGDDGCGGTCGVCGAASGCSGGGQCVPSAWSCNPAYFGASDACDCACGAADPDCKDPSNPIAGCSSLQKCDGGGKCVDKVPAGWTCLPTQYDALDQCNCGCGVPDPDCAIGSFTVAGCKTGESCSAAGTCQACVANCAGKSCGDDGCGGTCGACAGNTVCNGGACVDPCSPKPLVCTWAECGDDNCGGTCGTCADGKACDGGHCVAVGLPASPTSCVDHCGSTAPSGCSCTSKCTANGTCCDDYAAICSCKPNCAGKSCGPDGCGGTCGTCSGSAPFCDGSGQCVATCAPKCSGKSCGPDGCGGTCGTCGTDATCSWSAQCVPNAWQCPIAYFADTTACDCGCGAPDPDCQTGKLTTFGCPNSTDACDMASGLCKVTFCKTGTTCAGQACVGTYAAGSGSYGGVCGAQTGGAKDTGQFCSSGGECKTGVCLGGLCRQYCQADGDCPGVLKCLGIAVTGAANAVIGYAGVCEAINGSGVACAKQGDCAALGESCQAFVDAKTFVPRYLCAVGSKTSGGACGLSSCPVGQWCVKDSKGAHCGAVCPSGAADCTSGSCGSTAFNNAGTVSATDDPKVPVCVQP
jgi:hypothetical protein